MVLIKRTALLFIILPLIGSIFSCLYFTARIRGTFTEWETIGRPDAMPSKLIRMNYVQTEIGDIYEYQYEYGKLCKNNCWIKVDTIPPVLNMDDLLPIENCQNSFDIPSVDRFSDSVVECWRWGTGIRLDIQVIDKNGNVLMWQKGVDDFGDPLMLTTSPVLGAVSGLIIALILFIMVLIRAVIIYRPQRKVRTTRNAPINRSPTKRAPDKWDSPRFTGFFLTSGLYCSQTLSTPAHLRVTQTVSPLRVKQRTFPSEKANVLT